MARPKSLPKPTPDINFELIERTVAGQKVLVKVYKYKAPDEDDKRFVESVPTDKVRKGLGYRD